MISSNAQTVIAVDHAKTPTRPMHSYPPGYDPHSTPAPRLSPILHTSTVQLDPTRPEFAELLTPLKFRKRRTKPKFNQQPTSIPSVAGPSRLGYYTLEGDLYRGAARDPTIPIVEKPEDDVVSLSTGSTMSSSSNWSWGSGNFDRARAVIERVGEALGVRRGSSSSSSSSSDSDQSEDGRPPKSHVSGTRRRKGRRGSIRLSQTMSNLSRQSSGSPERPKREQVPRKREFTLLLPQTLGDIDIGLRVSPASSEKEVETLVGSEHSSKSGEKKYPPNRVIVTPSLPTILEKIRFVRLTSGFTPTDATPPQTPGIGPKIPVRRGGSAPGRTRAPKGASSFLNPPLPLRPVTQTRVQALRGSEPVRPQSVSDLLGLRNLPSPELGSQKGSNVSSRVGTPTVETDAPRIDEATKEKPQGCWWLDVSCPSWEDLRDIGELLGLHPLTLEDVLQQDPREKLDRFDKLGYYFLVIRALDENYFKYTPGSSVPSPQLPQNLPISPSPSEFPDMSRSRSGAPHTPAHGENHNFEDKEEGRRRGWGMGRAQGRMAGTHKMGEKVEIIEDRPGKEGLEGVGVGAVNVYLVVFADGVVSFHFEDISKHTHRVLDRLLTLGNLNHGADWIAHGLLDSIVDAFFPLIRYVDGAVDDIDSLTIDPSTDPKKTTAYLERVPSHLPSDQEFMRPEELGVVGLEEKSSAMGEKRKTGLWRSETANNKNPSFFAHVRSSIPSPSFPHSHQLARPFKYFSLFFLPTSSAVKRKHEQAPRTVFDRSTMLKNMTDMRKLVTGLSRLLNAKGAVVGRLRKRAKEEGGTVAAYIGDVEDHILLLQTSLHHYEYILSHCQPAYLSHLNVSFAFARGGTDQAILALSTVAISVLPMQFITSLFSGNFNVPHNGWTDCPSGTLCEPDGSPSPYNYFAGIVIAIFLVACVMVMVIRYWRWLARKKFGMMRGVEVPGEWEGFWGWS